MIGCPSPYLELHLLYKGTLDKQLLNTFVMTSEMAYWMMEGRGECRMMGGGTMDAVDRQEMTV